MNCPALVSILTLLLLPSTHAQVCGDCNGDGFFPTIIDAATAAQIGSGLLSPSSIQRIFCDVDGSGVVNILDAMLMARASAGLAVLLNCSSHPPTVVYTSPSPGAAFDVGGPCSLGTVPLVLAIDDPDFDPILLTQEFSTDGGANWQLIVPVSCETDSNPTSGVSSPTPAFSFDWGPILPCSGIPQPVSCILRASAFDGTYTAVATLGPILIYSCSSLICCSSPTTVTILIDSSISMLSVPIRQTPVPGIPGPDAWDFVTYNLNYFLSTAHHGMAFNIIAFNSTGTSSFKSRLVCTTSQNTAEAIAWFNTITPAGSADYVAGINAALATAPLGGDFVVLFSTGMPPGGVADINAVVAANAGYFVISALMLGPSATGATLLQSLVNQCGGELRWVQ